MNEVKDIVNKYTHKNNLEYIYVFPFSSNKYMYKIDVSTLKIYFIDFKFSQKLNNNDSTIRIDFNKRFLYFNQKEILQGYVKELLSISSLNNDAKSYLENIKNNYELKVIGSAKLILTILYFFALFFYVYSRKSVKKISEYEKNKDEYNRAIHFSQHDVKTNSTVILNKLGFISRLSNGFENDKSNKAKLNFLDCYSMELCILNANDYAKKGSFDQYKIPSDLKEEKILKWHNEETEITKEITKEIIDVNVSIDQLENYVIRDHLHDYRFYKDELSSAVFRLLNNAIKHKKRYTKVYLNIGICSNNRLKIEIQNEIIDGELEDEVTKKIETSLKSGNQHNLPIVESILSKYNMQLVSIVKDRKLILTIRERASL